MNDFAPRQLSSLQRTGEWRRERLGRITASRLGDVLAGESTKRHQGYLLEVAYGIAGVGGFDFDPPWMAHGKAWEDMARGEYEWRTGRTVRQVGLIRHGDLPYVGASPDGLVEDGCLEIKCRISIDAHLKSIGEVPPEYRPQVQGEMWVLGCEWNDFVSYWRADKSSALTIVRAHRDEKTIAKFERLCPLFWERANELAERLKQKRRA